MRLSSRPIHLKIVSVSLSFFVFSYFPSSSVWGVDRELWNQLLHDDKFSTLAHRLFTPAELQIRNMSPTAIVQRTNVNGFSGMWIFDKDRHMRTFQSFDGKYEHSRIHKPDGSGFVDREAVKLENGHIRVTIKIDSGQNGVQFFQGFQTDKSGPIYPKKMSTPDGKMVGTFLLPSLIEWRQGGDGKSVAGITFNPSDAAKMNREHAYGSGTFGQQITRFFHEGLTSAVGSGIINQKDAAKMIDRFFGTLGIDGNSNPITITANPDGKTPSRILVQVEGRTLIASFENNFSVSGHRGPALVARTPGGHPAFAQFLNGASAQFGPVTARNIEGGFFTRSAIQNVQKVTVTSSDFAGKTVSSQMIEWAPDVTPGSSFVTAIGSPFNTEKWLTPVMGAVSSAALNLQAALQQIVHSATDSVAYEVENFANRWQAIQALGGNPETYYEPKSYISPNGSGPMSINNLSPAALAYIDTKVYENRASAAQKMPALSDDGKTLNQAGKAWVHNRPITADERKAVVSSDLGMMNSPKWMAQQGQKSESLGGKSLWYGAAAIMEAANGVASTLPLALATAGIGQLGTTIPAKLAQTAVSGGGLALTGAGVGQNVGELADAIKYNDPGQGVRAAGRLGGDAMSLGPSVKGLAQGLSRGMQTGSHTGSKEPAPPLESRYYRDPPRQFFEIGGWKFHLAVKPGNQQAVHEWLWKQGVAYKSEHGGNVGVEDFTVYAGPKKTADVVAHKASQEIGDLLLPAGRADEIALAPNVVGRFDVQTTPYTHTMNQTGWHGVPFLSEDAVNLAFTRREINNLEANPRGASPDQIKSMKEKLGEKKTQAAERVFNVLSERLGDYFTGGAKTLAELVPSQTPVLDAPFMQSAQQPPGNPIGLQGLAFRESMEKERKKDGSFNNNPPRETLKHDPFLDR